MMETKEVMYADKRIGNIPGQRIQFTWFLPMFLFTFAFGCNEIKLNYVTLCSSKRDIIQQ